jgi:hypothetical protein
MQLKITVEKGELKISLSELVYDDTLLRAIAKTAIFEELLLEAVVKLAVSGQVEWADDPDGSPWWIGTSGRIPFEKMRVELAKLSDATSANTIRELTEQRNRIVANCDIFQRRAWASEQWIRDGVHHAFTRIGDDEFMRAKRIAAQPAYAAPLPDGY